MYIQNKSHKKIFCESYLLMTRNSPPPLCIDSWYIHNPGGVWSCGHNHIVCIVYDSIATPKNYCSGYPLAVG